MSAQPPCFDQCATRIRTLALATGTEMHVMVAPHVVIAGPYQPFIATCPHGVTYLAEPTGEQIAEWVRTQAT